MPLVIVTVFPAIEHAPLAEIVAVELALVVAETGNIELYPALAGAPANVIVGVALALAVVDWLAVATV